MVSESQRRRAAKKACLADPLSLVSPIPEALSPPSHRWTCLMQKGVHWEQKTELRPDKSPISIPFFCCVPRGGTITGFPARAGLL